MADTKTRFFQITNPEVGGSFDSWGDKETADRTLMDELLAIPRLAWVTTTDGEMDFDDGAAFYLLVDGNKTQSFANTPVAESGGENIGTVAYLLIQNGGAHTVTWDGSITWLGGVAPTLVTSGYDLLTFFTLNEGTTWFGARFRATWDFSDILGAVVTGQLAADAVTNAKLADNAVQNENILDGTIAQSKLAFSVQTSAEIPVHVSQAFYDGSNPAVQGILDVMASVGVIEIS